MERFLAFQKPLHRLDIYVSLKGEHCSAEIGDEAILLKIDGLQDLGKSIFSLCLNHTSHKAAGSRLVMLPHLWLSEKVDKVISFPPSLGLSKSIMTAYCELSLTTGGHRVRIADLTIIHLTVYMTSGLLGLVNRIVVDANGYKLFNCPVADTTEASSIEIPKSIAFDSESKKWVEAVSGADRNLMFEPPSPSGRHHPLLRV